jgi:hypothetical protein
LFRIKSGFLPDLSTLPARGDLKITLKRAFRSGAACCPAKPSLSDQIDYFPVLPRIAITEYGGDFGFVQRENRVRDAGQYLNAGTSIHMCFEKMPFRASAEQIKLQFPGKYAQRLRTTSMPVISTHYRWERMNNLYELWPEPIAVQRIKHAAIVRCTYRKERIVGRTVERGVDARYRQGHQRQVVSNRRGVFHQSENWVGGSAMQ